ncbi:unnamed protein product [Thlaspi arvense]|uniref:KIB1-4 beta-propeller domain-containing protein n=1 Tax=Thlaspi arvense TaxID=13288 RepID=A0AAU9S2L9_THLAR|nr:unnamed protein product [Thlaspi arvense]
MVFKESKLYVLSELQRITVYDFSGGDSPMECAISGQSSKWSILKSLGEEALLMDQGITVAAKDGVLKNCIYYSNDQLYRRIGSRLKNDYNVICVCNIQTKKQVQVFPHLTASDARWFFPTFSAK